MMTPSESKSVFSCHDKRRIALELFDGPIGGGVMGFAQKIAWAKATHPEFMASHRGICMMALDPKTDREDVVKLMDLQIDRDEGRITEDEMMASFRKHMSDKMTRMYPEIARKVVGDAQVDDVLRASEALN